MVLALKDTADFPIPTKNIVDNDSNFNYNTSGSINAYDRTYLDIINANRTKFFPPANVLVERSTDGGSTWTTVDTSTYTTAQRGNLMCDVGASLPIGTGNADVNQQLRVTLQYPGTAWYCSLDRAYIRWTTGGHSNTVTVQKSTYGAQTTYTDLATNVEVNGWSGDNMIKFTSQTAWGTNNSGHIYNVRFIFKYSSVNSTYVSNQSYVSKIDMFGKDFWGTTGTPRSYGHLYNWDYLQNVTFPAKVTATNFKVSGSGYPHYGGNTILTMSATGGWYSGAGCLVLSSTDFRPSGNDSGQIDLGTSSGKWKNLYLTGNISNGTYTYSLPSSNGTLALEPEITESGTNYGEGAEANYQMCIRYPNGLQIITGYYNDQVTLYKNNYADKTIVFTKPFSALPNVVVGLQSDSTSPDMGNITVSTCTTTTTQFIARYFYYNAGAAGRKPGIRWTAIGFWQ